MAHVNDQLALDLPEQPMRGQKNSGIGRLNGAWAIEAFTTHQWITVQHSLQPQQSSILSPPVQRNRWIAANRYSTRLGKRHSSSGSCPRFPI
jgi:hypothetical protein